MKIVIFCHSLVSDWNHGNAHFLRGIVAELQARRHDVHVYEPQEGWSLRHLLMDAGPRAVAAFRRAFPTLRSRLYTPDRLDLERALDGADLVLVHEWNEPDLVRRIGRHRARGGRYTLFFHDTHHRSVTDAQAMAQYDLAAYDGVLAFGAVVRERYERMGWGRRVWTWHEAADTRVFFPRRAPVGADLVWIGNWGDGERTAELQDYFVEPVRALGLRATAYGVRYPPEALAALAPAGIRYRGWLANHRAPSAYARHRMTIHVPRRPYVEWLPGVPTIRVFEALASGLPLVIAGWRDIEGLFTAGSDFLIARTPAEMQRHLRAVSADPDLSRELSAHGLATIHARHTCAHRVDELAAIVGQARGGILEALSA